MQKGCARPNKLRGILFLLVPSSVEGMPHVNLVLDATPHVKLAVIGYSSKQFTAMEKAFSPSKGSTLEVHGCNLQESDKDAMKSN